MLKVLRGLEIRREPTILQYIGAARTQSAAMMLNLTYNSVRFEQIVRLNLTLKRLRG